MTRPPKVRPKKSNFGGRYFMSKYSYEFKKKVVMDYINGKGGYKSLCKEMGYRVKQYYEIGSQHTKNLGTKD